MSRAVRRGVMAASRRRTTATPAPRANALGNDGQTAASATIAITIPATAQAGDVAVVALEAAGSRTITAAPSGWTAVAGPNVTTGSEVTSWLYRKTIAGGEPGTSVSWTVSASSRNGGHMAVYSGVTETGALSGTVTDSTASTSAAIPTVASVPAGALFHVHWTRLRATIPAADITAPGGYSQGTSERAASNFASGNSVSTEAAYKVVGAGGSYGGETATVSASSFGTTYAVALPAA